VAAQSLHVRRFMPPACTATLLAAAIPLILLGHASRAVATPITPSFTEVERSDETERPGQQGQAAKSRRCSEPSIHSAFYRSRADECGRTWISAATVQIGSPILDVSVGALGSSDAFPTSAVSNAAPSTSSALLLTGFDEVPIAAVSDANNLPLTTLAVATAQNAPNGPAALASSVVQTSLPMPEPATLSLFGAGISVLAWGLRRRAAKDPVIR
jgi:hypothetical protein